MKPIAKDELYEHTSQFLKSRGIELKDGSYTKKIQKGFSLLTDAINLTNKGIEKASTELDAKLSQLRHVIHEKTAPKAQATPPPVSAPRAKPPVQTKSRAAGKKKATKARRA